MSSLQQFDEFWGIPRKTFVKVVPSRRNSPFASSGGTDLSLASEHKTYKVDMADNSCMAYCLTEMHRSLWVFDPYRNLIRLMQEP